jgi:hypothetical protein
VVQFKKRKQIGLQKLASSSWEHAVGAKIRKTRRKNMKQLRPTTHMALGFLVGAGFNQQPRTVRVTIPSGKRQRRRSMLI